MRSCANWGIRAMASLRIAYCVFLRNTQYAFLTQFHYHWSLFALSFILYLGDMLVGVARQANPRRGWHRCSPGRKPCGPGRIMDASPVGAALLPMSVSPLRGLGARANPIHRAYALGYSCFTPFGGSLGRASQLA